MNIKVLSFGCIALTASMAQAVDFPKAGGDLASADEIKRKVQVFKVMNRTVLLVVSLFLGLFAPGVSAFAYNMTEPLCGPWLQNASETTMSVGWSTRANCAAGIEYRVKGTKDWTREWETRSGKLDCSRDLHAFHLKGLRPATEYEYRILSSMHRSDSYFVDAYTGRQIYTFRTFDSARDAYSVFLLSDLHGLYGRLEPLYRRFGVAGCDFVVFLGDQVNDNVNQPRFSIEDSYLREISRLWGTTKPSVFIRGNHDCWGRFATAAWADYHGRPDDQPYHAFTHGPVLYVVLDCPDEYTYGSVWKMSDAAKEVRARFLDRQFDWFANLRSSADWTRAKFRVVMSHYGVRLGHGALSDQLKTCYKPYLNGADGIHLYLSGDDHFAASCLPGEKTWHHNPRHDTKAAGKSVFPPFDGSFDFTEVSGDKCGALVLEVSKTRLLVRTGDNKADGPDLERIEIRPDKSAKRLEDAGASASIRVSERFGFDPADSTRFLQAALDSGLPEIVVDYKEKPWVTEPLFVRSNQKIVFEKGVVLLAKRGKFVGRNDSLLRAKKGVENVTISGYGATFRMWREDYARGKDGEGRDYRRGEWRHALALDAARNVTVEGLTLEDSGGDGVFLGADFKALGTPDNYCRDIVLRDLVCDRNHRQGLSACAFENLLVENCVFKNTRGAWPMDGVDLEPDKADQPIVNGVFRNCVAENNAGNGFEIALRQCRKTSRPTSVRFENCRTIGSRSAVVVRTGSPVSDGGYHRGTIAFDGCSFEKCDASLLHVMQVPENSLSISFRNCRASSIGLRDPTAPLALLDAVAADDPLPAMPDLSGLVCDDLGDRARYRYCTRNFASLGETDIPCLAPEILEPRVVDSAPGTFSPCTVNQLAGKLRFVAYADRSRKICLRARRVRAGGGRPALPAGWVAVTNLTTGKAIAKLALPGYETEELAFDAPTSGFYSLTTEVSDGELVVEATDSPLAADCTRWDYRKRPLRFLLSTGSLYLPVAAGQQGAFVVGGDLPIAKVGMQVADPQGKSVFKDDSVLYWTRYVIPKSKEDGLWTLSFSKPSAGLMWYYFAEAVGVRPYLFLAKDKFWYSK